jgi:hypothetical protein
MPIAKGRGNRLGLFSVVLSTCFWFYEHSTFGPNAFTRNPYVTFVLLPAMLIMAAAAAVAAGVRGSRWWLLALMGPLAGALLMLTAST